MRCIGCGAEVADIEYPVHSDMRTSPGCWAIFCELLGREFSDPAYWPVHQLTVNAYALQHTASNPALHLMALFLSLERGFSDERILPVMRRASAKKARLPSVHEPSALGELNVLHARAARDASEHVTAVRQWAESVWQAWSAAHGAIRDFVEELFRASDA